jgi:hypothetical protein
MGMGKKLRHGGKNSSLEIGHGRKNSDMVGKFPHGWKKEGYKKA